MRLIVLFCLMFIANHTFSQTKNDPVPLRDDGLPVASPREAGLQDIDRTRDDYQPTRQHIPGTINRTDEPEQQPLEYRSAFEVQESERHFRNDTTRVTVKDPGPGVDPGVSPNNGGVRVPE